MISTQLNCPVVRRWFKMMMADTISNRVFLDSDDVNKLDSILDVTSRDTDSHPLLEQMFQIAFIVSFPRVFCITWTHLPENNRKH